MSRSTGLFGDQLDSAIVDGDLGRTRSGRRSKEHQTWHGTAFVLESVMLLLFIAISMAVVCMLFGNAYKADKQAECLTQAMALATTASANGAEAFTADPEGSLQPSQLYYTVDDGAVEEIDNYIAGCYVVRRTVTASEREAGTMYEASIEVSQYNTTICTLQTSSYVSSREA